MRGLNFKDIKMSTKDTVKSLLSMSSKIKVNNTKFNLSTFMLFEKK